MALVEVLVEVVVIDELEKMKKRLV